jgi:hypothetical protein
MISLLVVYYPNHSGHFVVSNTKNFRMKHYLPYIFLLPLALLIDGCIQPFSPPEVNSPENFLVVDGFLNLSNDTSRVELRRTQNTKQTANPTLERNATVSAEAETGQTFAFKQTSPGVYLLPPNQYNKATKYRLRIKTASGKEYLSDYVTVSTTPPIDSVTYKVDSFLNSAVFMVNTHDPANKTNFYRWKFEETWEYRAAYQSALEVVKKQIVSRKNDVNLCWRTTKSTNIVLGSTIKLNKDVIQNLPIFSVPIITNKLYIKYSVLVKQYALSQLAFEYWTSLAKTTETTGGLFDPQPSQVTGNIKNISDPKELVFGYFSAGTVATTRLTITPNLGAYPTCPAPDTLDVVCNPRSERQCALESGDLLIQFAGEASQYVLGAAPSCTDCTTQGGTTVRPSFW